MTVLDLDHPRYKLGLIHDHKPSEVPDLAEFQETSVPKPPSSVQIGSTIWPMACNDTEGDCTIAGATHVNQAGALVVGADWVYQGDADTSATYLGLTPGHKDTGLLLPQVLKPWHLKGLFGQEPNGGYASVHPGDTNTVKQSVWIFGNGYVAVNLPAIAQQQFKANGSGVWELTHTAADYDIEGGHCIVAVAYGPEGVTCVTWGGTVLVTWEWWLNYVVQVYAVVPPAFVANSGDGRGYNLAAIDGYLPKMAA